MILNAGRPKQRDWSLTTSAAMPIRSARPEVLTSGVGSYPGMVRWNATGSGVGAA